MIFKPNTVACAWDTWLFYKAGIHFLFYLYNSRKDAPWDGIGIATSVDGVHFSDHGPIIQKAVDAVWLGTGMTWEVNGKYYLNFSELRAGQQEIFFAESDDLLNWRRLPDKEYICRMDPRWYSEAPTTTSQRWDCIWVLPDGEVGGYIGYLTAVARDGPNGLCGTAGCVISPDGKHFKAAPPVIETGFWPDAVEVGAVEKINGQYYMLLGVYQAPLGARHFSHLLAGECGMYVLTSKKSTGPFRMKPRQPLLLGSSPSIYTYFARFYRSGETLLVNHHTVSRNPPQVSMNAGPDVMLAPLKEARVDDEGILNLQWWPGNDVLKGRTVPVALDQCSYSRSTEEADAQPGRLSITARASGIAYLPNHFDLQKGIVLEGNLLLDRLNGPLSSLGIFIEGQPAGTGSLALLQTNGCLTVGPYNGYNYRPEDSKPFPYNQGTSVNWRVLLRGAYLEVYLDEVHTQSYTINHSTSGRIGFVVESGSANMRDVKVWEMSFEAI